MSPTTRARGHLHRLLGRGDQLAGSTVTAVASPAMRTTTTLVKVARALLDEPDERHYGYALMKSAEIRSGVMYPLLARLLEHGFLTDGWEDFATIKDQRPPRRYYELTDLGKVKLTEIVNTANRAQEMKINRVQVVS